MERLLNTPHGPEVQAALVDVLAGLGWHEHRIQYGQRRRDAAHPAFFLPRTEPGSLNYRDLAPEQCSDIIVAWSEYTGGDRSYLPAGYRNLATKLQDNSNQGPHLS